MASRDNDIKHQTYKEFFDRPYPYNSALSNTAHCLKERLDPMEIYHFKTPIRNLNQSMVFFKCKQNSINSRGFERLFSPSQSLTRSSVCGVLENAIPNLRSDVNSVQQKKRPQTKQSNRPGTKRIGNSSIFTEDQKY